MVVLYEGKATYADASLSLHLLASQGIWWIPLSVHLLHLNVGAVADVSVDIFWINCDIVTSITKLAARQFAEFVPYCNFVLHVFSQRNSVIWIAESFVLLPGKRTCNYALLCLQVAVVE